MFGFLNVDKPAGMTSHDVVARLRRRAKQIAGAEVKIGHAGTLDPMATGVLVVCVGAAARLSEYVMDTTKRYLARVRLGQTTDTYDAEGAIMDVRSIDDITENVVRAALGAFSGEMAQVPPMYSAIKQGGRRLYDLARAGQVVERAARHVRIDALALSDWQPPDFSLDVTCSAGTYIRSLAHDLGQALGVGAHLVGLRRLASGSFAASDAAALQMLLDASSWDDYLISARRALIHLPALTMSAEEADALRHGRFVAKTGGADGTALAYDDGGALIAVLHGEGAWWKPQKVMA
jgi:tRNA pseudouridine55 synthase